MEVTTPGDSTRRRNVSWHRKIDEIATELAHQHRMKGGVSELTARLILEARKIKRRLPAVTKESIAAASK